MIIEPKGYSIGILSRFVSSPYTGLPESKWRNKTIELINEYPLDLKILKNIVLQSWDDLLSSTIGAKLKIGKDFQPSPQLTAGWLHTLICIKITDIDDKEWACEKNASDKDIINLKNSKYSTEIKTSSSPSKIFANRSYAQSVTDPKKSKSGYYLAVNFEKITIDNEPKIILVRLGWLDHSDWIAQTSETGQQARLSPITYATKLLEI